MTCWKCGHGRSSHTNSIKFDRKIICRTCDYESDAPYLETDPQYHSYEDNLDYVERVAKDRKLI